MGLFSNLFKGKDNNVVINEENKVQVIQQPVQQSVQTVQQSQQQMQDVQISDDVNPVNEVVTPNINSFPTMINTDPSNVLEQMQNRAIEEAEAEAQSSELAGDPMDVFNQNIVLDGDNPMSVFGGDNQNNG